ncbi:MAG: DUF4097 domain-containing protein [Lachnospiraceae bacterium]|nr:DUF4097 domain-containing protein [Lachnospiraceae bacterium]
MNTWKKLAVVAGVLLGAGVVICAVAFAVLGCDWNRLSTQEFVTNTYSPDADFRDIRIETDTEDLLFVMTRDGTCKVVCYEDPENLFEVRTENDTLVIDRPEKPRMGLQFGFYTQSPSITVYLPAKEYGEISLKTDTGDLLLAELSASSLRFTSDTGDVTLSGIRLSGNLEIREDTGRVTLQDMSCADLTVRSTTGDQTLTDTAASGSMNLTTDTGDVRFDGSDAASLQIKTDTGDVTGSLGSDKIFSVKTDTGKIEVPQSGTGGQCRIETDTGDIRITIQN